MSYVDPVLAFVLKLIIAGGGGAAVAYLMIKAFAKGWLDAYFDSKKTKLKNEQDVALAELKRVHDAALKDVQAIIDKDLHRARKLYDREFDVLSEAWTLLFKAFDTTQSAIASFPVRVGDMDEKVRNRAFQDYRFEHWQIDQVMAVEGDERTAKFNDIVERRRLVEYRDNRLAFARFLAVNAVFMPAGFKERFMSVDAMINAALVEFEVRLNYPVKFGATWDSMLKLSEKGKQELDELEKLIHQRIWSAGNERDKISV